MSKFPLFSQSFLPTQRGKKCIAEVGRVLLDLSKVTVCPCSFLAPQYMEFKAVLAFTCQMSVHFAAASPAFTYSPTIISKYAPQPCVNLAWIDLVCKTIHRVKPVAFILSVYISKLPKRLKAFLAILILVLHGLTSRGKKKKHKTKHSLLIISLPLPVNWLYLCWAERFYSWRSKAKKSKMKQQKNRINFFSVHISTELNVFRARSYQIFWSCSATPREHTVVLLRKPP